MKASGEEDLIKARTGLLDAIEALKAHRDALALVGAQAVYHWTDDVDLGLAPHTLDADLAVDVRLLTGDPRLEKAMGAAGFDRGAQPGIWFSPQGVQVDLMVAEEQAGPGGSRGAQLDGHHKHAARRTKGLEAVLVDAEKVVIGSLDPSDPRRKEIKVAGPGALLVAKMHKISDRLLDGGNRVEGVGKDCTDVLRLLRAREEHRLGERVAKVLSDPLSQLIARVAVTRLQELFGDSSGTGNEMLRQAAPDGPTGGEWAASAVALVGELVA